MLVKNVAYAGAKLNVHISTGETIVRLASPGPAPLLLAVNSQDGVTLTAAEVSIASGGRARIFTSGGEGLATFL